MSRTRTQGEASERKAGWIQRTLDRLARSREPQEPREPRQRAGTARSTDHLGSKRGYQHSDRSRRPVSGNTARAVTRTRRAHRNSIGRVLTHSERVARNLATQARQ